ncbi:hypothetical protein AAJ76_600040938 [Vairimorpha ceranae]|uniref:Uncharacterized protein n=1 Tax=Vairimorpha ceranae TaxID=40302 RepID=A0A0F9WHQ6_9MICR|nr:hypothetical protein AAJ76_600040938 [Vairimorpha ceranae]KAF5140087.1 hypothetical protein G9O61_00g018120 [Vairimorpha ceranae]KKO76140.1 hypothetical protein AAJ76_600040938 [Vairimorpha ceranae]
MNATQVIKNELALLSKLYYKSKNQFKSSELLNRINEVRKLGNKFQIANSEYIKLRLQNACINLYIAASSYFKMGHFVKFSLLLFGISSRIYSFLEFNFVYKDEIDDIFGDL